MLETVHKSKTGYWRSSSVQLGTHSGIDSRTVDSAPLDSPRLRLRLYRSASGSTIPRVDTYITDNVDGLNLDRSNALNALN